MGLISQPGKGMIRYLQYSREHFIAEKLAYTPAMSVFWFIFHKEKYILNAFILSSSFGLLGEHGLEAKICKIKPLNSQGYDFKGAKLINTHTVQEFTVMGK